MTFDIDLEDTWDCINNGVLSLDGAASYPRLCNTSAIVIITCTLLTL